VIFVLSLGLWALLTFPRDVTFSRDFDREVAVLEERAAAAPDDAREPLAAQIAELRAEQHAERSRQTYLGRMGRAIEPVLRPLGFDWKVGVGILGSFAAREVFVSTLGVIHAAGDEADEDDPGLRAKLRAERWPDGRPVHTPLSGISLCVFYVLAMQCMSTLAILKRESGGWKWPAGIFVTLTVVAYVASLVVYQGGLALGF
jgi:ferrous iron transport protein B